MADGEIPAQAEPESAIADLLDRYEVREALGSGGMGFVFKGWDLRLRTHVAIKIARPELTRERPLQERLIREARAAAAIHHERIVGIRDIGEAENGTPFVVMDYLDGEPLSAILRDQGRMAWQGAVELLGQIASGLQAAHDAGIVHRDLKPGNVFVTDHPGAPRCTLIDFGLARVVEMDDEARTLTQAGQIVGTPRYMSPEQISGESPVTPLSDVYALGCVAFHMLSGAAPFSGALHQLLHRQLHERPPRLESVPPAIARVVYAALEKTPSNRPASAAEFQSRLLAAAATSTAAVPGGKRERWGVALAAGAAGLLGGWMLRGSLSEAGPATPARAGASEPTSVSAPAVVSRPAEPPAELKTAVASIAPPVVGGDGGGDDEGEDPSSTHAPHNGISPVAAEPAVDAAQPEAPPKSRPRPSRSNRSTARRPDSTPPIAGDAESAPAADAPRTRAQILQELDGLQ